MPKISQKLGITFVYSHTYLYMGTILAVLVYWDILKVCVKNSVYM